MRTINLSARRSTGCLAAGRVEIEWAVWCGKLEASVVDRVTNVPMFLA